MTTAPRRWRKASRSQNTGTCVEIALDTDAHVRDTKDRHGGELDLPARAWSAFVAELKAPRA